MTVLIRSLLPLLLTCVSLVRAGAGDPWQATLDEQLARLRAQYGSRPLDLIVVHLGITARKDDALRTADELSAALGRPVIALPSYAGNSNLDLARTVGQYLSDRVLPGHFADAWQQIIGSGNGGNRIVGVIVHSGAGLRFNSERASLLDVIRFSPGKVSGPLVFVETDLYGLTRQQFTSAGMECSQIGEIGAVPWVTRPACRYVLFGERLGILASVPGTFVKLQASAPAILDALQGLPVHSLESRLVDIERAFDKKTPESGPTTTAPAGDRTGGIDFSTLELRYLAEPDGPTPALAAVFRVSLADSGPVPEPADSFALSWQALFTWLALPNRSFWVNLNPNEPDRIIDPELGKTDAGRIMLEADLQMKRDLGRLTHPQNSPLGKEFWTRVYDHIIPGLVSSGRESVRIEVPVTFRVWIVPGRIVICTTARSIRVVEAGLNVMLESDYLGGAPSTAQRSENQTFAEGLLKSLVLPALVQEVNHAPQYAALRQVFFSRVVAEWYKQRPRAGAIFRPVIGLGNADTWRSAVAWSARSVFDRYRQSLTNGEYSLSEAGEVSHGGRQYSFERRYFTGGVDWTLVPMTAITPEQLRAATPDAEATLWQALFTSTCPGEHELWLGEIIAAPAKTDGDTGR
jgi:hypothetical protein